MFCLKEPSYFNPDASHLEINFKKSTEHLPSPPELQ